MPALGSATDIQTLARALAATFEHENQLAQMMRLRLRRNLDATDGARTNRLTAIIDAQIAIAERDQWTTDLVQAAYAENPANMELYRLAASLGFVTALPPGFEALVDRNNPFLDFATWSHGLPDIEGRVCRIELSGRPMGTAFLVGEEMVMTNWHVVYPLMEHPELCPDVRLRFDYKRLPGSATAYPGTEFSLASNWLLDFSPSPPITATEVPPADQLDYAVLRVARDREGVPVGQSRVGGTRARGAGPRGWLSAPAVEHLFVVGQGLVIAQHPSGDPLQLAFEPEAVQRINQNGTRVRYNTNTLAGSSGSPCFNTRMELVALHHGGDPAHPDYARFNQGIPIARICELLKKRGHHDVLQPPPARLSAEQIAAFVGARTARTEPPSRQRQKTGWYREPDEPYTAYLVGRGGFVDRASYRASLREMSDEYGEKILCIVGQPRSGKSFSWFLLNHIARHSDADAIKIDLQNWPDGATPANIVDHIASTLDMHAQVARSSGPHTGTERDLRPDIDVHAQATRQRMQLVRWLIGKLNARARRVWLFFDHVDADTVRPDTRELLHDLGLAADECEADLRLILVGMAPDRLDESLRYSARQDWTGGVTRADVESFLIALGRHLGVELPPAEARLAVDTIYADPAAEPMRRLPQNVRKLACRLFAPERPGHRAGHPDDRAESGS